MTMNFCLAGRNKTCGRNIVKYKCQGKHPKHPDRNNSQMQSGPVQPQCIHCPVKQFPRIKLEQNLLKNFHRRRKKALL